MFTTKNILKTLGALFLLLWVSMGISTYMEKRERDKMPYTQRVEDVKKLYASFGESVGSHIKFTLDHHILDSLKVAEAALKDSLEVARTVHMLDSVRARYTTGKHANLHVIHIMNTVNSEKAVEFAQLLDDYQSTFKKKLTAKRRDIYINEGEAAFIRVMRGEIAIGDSETALYEAWGYPEHVNETKNKYGTNRQYVYPANYVYSDDGVITTIQSRY